MKLAISNIAWLSQDDEFVYDLMEKYGYTGLEIAPSRIIPDAPYDNIDYAVKWKEKIRTEKRFEIPSIQSVWYGRKENLFASEEEREILRDYMKKAIIFAESIECPSLVMGCPKNRNIPSGEEQKAMEVAIQFFGELGEFAIEHHTAIALEAVPVIYNTNFVNDTETAIDLIKEIGSKGFRLNLDIGTIIENGEDIRIVEKAVDYINHVHISEPGLIEIRERELHLELRNILEKMNYDKYISIEMGKENNIENVIKYVAKIFGN